jgi:predicted nucleic acid-binding protein
MSRRGKNKIVIDACVLYQAPTRDLILNFAYYNLFVPIWTNEINTEWSNNLLINRKNIKAKSLQKTIDAMNSAFPNSNVQTASKLTRSLVLPDPKDRHVLAAAIKSNATSIITYNLKDFPVHNISRYKIEIHHPDDFLYLMMIKNQRLTIEIVTQIVESLNNPPITKIDLIENYKKIGLIKTARLLKQIVLK